MASSPDSPPKRPRLSLQIKAISNGPSVRTSRTLAAAVNPTSPTSFNTLSNVYVTAIGKSCASPIVSEPLTAIRTSSSSSLSSYAKLPVLKLQTGPQIQTGAAAPSGMFPDTPLTAQPRSPAVYHEIKFPSAMTATPPLSAGPVETAVDSRAFSFSCEDTVASRLATATAAAAGSPRAAAAASMSPRTPRRRATAPGRAGGGAPPYTHPRSLHSILRNSPLPHKPTRSPVSPRRQSQRLREKALRRVEYDSPLEQTITTNKYTKSHIDLLCEEAANSPYSASPTTNPPQPTTTPATTPTTATATGDCAAAAATATAAAAAAASTMIITPTQPETIVLDLAMAYTGDETRDGGRTPGPFEEMRRRMASLAASSPLSSPSSSGVRKRGGGGASKRKEKKRRWVWTIGIEDEAGDGDEVGGAIAAARAAEAAAAGTPVTATPSTTTTMTTASTTTTTPNSAGAPVVLAPNPRPRARSAAGAAKLAVVTAAVSAAISAAVGSTSSTRARALSEEPLTAIPRPLSIDTARCLGYGGRPAPEEITPSIESSDLSQGGWSAAASDATEEDVEMSDASSVVSDLPRGLTPGDGDMDMDLDLDLVTPTLPRKHRSVSRLGSEDLFAQGQSGARRDTPIPSDLICS
ncbi:hypothetical protein RB595_005333 [Gaeumannomyces hyphopodioides]